MIAYICMSLIDLKPVSVLCVFTRKLKLTIKPLNMSKGATVAAAVERFLQGVAWSQYKALLKRQTRVFIYTSYSVS